MAKEGSSVSVATATVEHTSSHPLSYGSLSQRLSAGALGTMWSAQRGTGIEGGEVYGEVFWHSGVTAPRASTPMGSGPIGSTEQPVGQNFSHSQHSRGSLVRNLQANSVSMLREPTSSQASTVLVGCCHGFHIGEDAGGSVSEVTRNPAVEPTLANHGVIPCDRGHAEAQLRHSPVFRSSRSNSASSMCLLGRAM